MTFTTNRPKFERMFFTTEKMVEENEHEKPDMQLNSEMNNWDESFFFWSNLFAWRNMI